MKLFMCSVRDSAVDSYMRPFMCRSGAEGVRAFGDSVKGQDSGMKAHPEDYELYHVGYFTEETGAVEPCEKRLLIRAIDCIK